MKLTINSNRPLHLFEGYGIEMEYMIVQNDTLDILPLADKLLEKVAGKIVNEISRDGLAWSNELALHVIEVKSDGPATQLAGAGEIFQNEIEAMESVLKSFNARLMPGAMHPWMDPFTEVKLWPHEYNPIYEAYNRIFDCRGHGWANLQSTHLNLPFFGDAEFEKLHAALRLILPLIPAIAASSPIADSEKKGWLDYRMEAYRTNSLKIPSITGKIVPERVFNEADYREKIFEWMYRDIAPYDPEGILQDEWLNSRGAMSRWDRNAIEVRVIDLQELPAADIAILEWVVNLAKFLTDEKTCSLQDQKEWHEDELYDLLMSVIRDGEKTVFHNRDFLEVFGLKKMSATAGELTRHITDILASDYSFDVTSLELLNLIHEEGPLSRRILNALPENFDKQDLASVYTRLCDSLRNAAPFIP
ncbi:MAG: glutamate-cysteine ligase family protein [Balneolaceae bacterium]|nr:glutamate-cysteine ligase family protein [Balneolaceae bacterium]